MPFYESQTKGSTRAQGVQAPAHWFRYQLDKHASIWIKDIDLDEHMLTYKVLSTNGDILDPLTRSSWSYHQDEVILRTVQIPMECLNSAISLLTN